MSDEDERTTYRVPVEGFGGCYVVADDPEEAVEEAEKNATTSDLNLQIDANAVEQTEPVEDEAFRGPPANVSSPPENQRVEVPTVPTVGELRRARERLDLTISEVADYLDVTASGVGKWERGESAISLEQARNYASVLGRLQRGEEDVLEHLNRRA